MATTARSQEASREPVSGRLVVRTGLRPEMTVRR